MINNEDLENLNKRAKNREEFIKKAIETSDRLANFPVSTDFLWLTRQWNSWYPSSIHVEGGCYLFNINDEIVIIDPGFNTLNQIREMGLDIRLVRYIFVTHFHPDHFSDLVALLTRLTSDTNKLTVFLNSTTYEYFKIYARSPTSFTEINSGQQLVLEFKIKDIRYQVLVEITKAFHREIGGLHEL